LHSCLNKCPNWYRSFDQDVDGGEMEVSPLHDEDIDSDESYHSSGGFRKVEVTDVASSRHIYILNFVLVAPFEQVK
jgi:hypothetical protein